MSEIERAVMNESGNDARRRDDIDAGLHRDKVPFPDPAAAPLGTDDEAGTETPEIKQADKPVDAAVTTSKPQPSAAAHAQRRSVLPWVIAAIPVVLFAAIIYWLW
jgi:hypothetical protein